MYTPSADYQTASILDDPNPLSISTITITPAANGLPCCIKPKISVVQKVGISLQLILRKEFGNAYDYEWSVDEAIKIMADQSLQLAHCSPAAALAALKMQLKAYFNWEDPFNWKKHENKTAWEWWMDLLDHKDADILAVGPYFLGWCTLCLLVHRL